MSSISTLELTETDEAGVVVATYVHTSSTKGDVTRIDKFVSTLRSLMEPSTHCFHRCLRIPKDYSRHCLILFYQPGILIP